MNKRSLLTLAILFIVFLFAAIGFASLADEVHEGDTLAFDQSLLRGINAHASPTLNQFFLTVTQLGSPIGVVVVTITGLVVLIRRKNYKRATVLGAGVAGAAIINLVLKSLFERARPDLWQKLVTETSYSFPSGHAMMSSILAFAAIAIFWRTKYRIPVTIFALLFMLLVGFSRLYLGVHYPTDVVAGWFVSAAWIAIVVSAVDGWIYRKSHRRI